MIQRQILGSTKIHSPARLCYCCAHRASEISVMDTSLAPWMDSGPGRHFPMRILKNPKHRAEPVLPGCSFHTIAPILPCHWKPVHSNHGGCFLYTLSSEQVTCSLSQTRTLCDVGWGWHQENYALI